MTDSFAEHYHARTKYHPETLANQARALDWDEQPSPYKTYDRGASVDLRSVLRDRPEASPDISPGEDRLRALSRLLYLTNGITAQVPGMGIFLRSTPSAGGLYPAEVYVLSRGATAIPAGIYNYQVRDHSLVQFAEGDPWEALQGACFQHPVLEGATLAIATTAVFFRSAWRYRDRAYRRIYLDTGHLLGNAELAAALVGFRACLVAGFADAALDALLQLDPAQEGSTAVLVLRDRDAAAPEPAPTALASETCLDFPDLPDDTLLGYLHSVSRIAPNVPAPVPPDIGVPPDADKYNFPFGTKAKTDVPPVDWGEGGEALERAMLRRRSTRAYTGEGLTFEELAAVLDFAYQPQHYGDAGLDPAPDYCDLSLVETFVAVSEVAGLEDGCYYYAPKAGELRQIRFKNFRQELHFLCLQQDLGRDAAALLFQTVDLAAAVARYGDRAYRYLHLDSGHLGQRANLAATHLGIGVSGIAGFFDDRVNDVLGIPEDEAVLYITTLGRPRLPG